MIQIDSIAFRTHGGIHVKRTVTPIQLDTALDEVLFAIDRRDLPLMQAVVMVTVVGFALANLAADVLYALLNPRIRLGE